MPKPAVKRSDVKPGENLCDFCTAKCCKYFALPIDAPTDWADFDHMRWFLMHGRCALFVEDAQWFLMVYADCRHLLPNNLCGVYHTRPQICRDYSTENCEYDDTATYDKFFETAEQIWEYAEAVMPPKERKPAMRVDALPVI